jgi:hypothetical protein
LSYIDDHDSVLNIKSKRKKINPLLNFINQGQVAGLDPNLNGLGTQILQGAGVVSIDQTKTATQKLKSLGRKMGEYFLSIDLGCLLE